MPHYYKKLLKIGFHFNQKINFLKINKDSVFGLPCSVNDADLQILMEVGAFSYIGKGIKNYSPLKIGRFCSIGEDVKIGLHNHPIDRESTSPFFYVKDWFGNIDAGFTEIEEYKEIAKPVIIEDDVWIGANVLIIGGVKIGKGSIIGAGAVVTKDVPPHHIVAGVPARKIGERKIKDFNAKFYAEKYGKGEVNAEILINYLPFLMRMNIKRKKISKVLRDKIKTLKTL